MNGSVEGLTLKRKTSFSAWDACAIGSCGLLTVRVCAWISKLRERGLGLDTCIQAHPHAHRRKEEITMCADHSNTRPSSSSLATLPITTNTQVLGVCLWAVSGHSLTGATAFHGQVCVLVHAIQLLQSAVKNTNTPSAVLPCAVHCVILKNTTLTNMHRSWEWRACVWVGWAC